jgi:hypothetical protein
MQKKDLNIDELIKEYEITHNLHKVAKKFKTSHIRVSKLLKEHIEIFNVGKKREVNNELLEQMINDYQVKLLTMQEISKKYKLRIKRIRSLFKENGVKISKWNGHVKNEKKPKKVRQLSLKETKKCPYCNWETVDVNNKSNAYEKHLSSCHNIDIDAHLKIYPTDEFYLKGFINRKNKVKCLICGEYLHLIDDRHLTKHNITKCEYINKFGDSNIISVSTKDKLKKCIDKMNQNESWPRFESNYEKEIKELLLNNNIDFEQHNRKILNGFELDFLIKNIAIEFNGNKWHTESFGGKNRMYHLDKLQKCNNNGIKLIHIFEDEYVFHKEIVLNKISHILGIKRGLARIPGRKCIIKEIDTYTAKNFLDAYHIQGFSMSTIYLGAYFNNILIGVMSFKIENKNSNNWDLTRFASDYHYVCQGVGGKLFNYFIRNYNPDEVKSFADRRWTVDEENNIYIQLGFKFDKYLAPEYRYYNPKVDKFKRFHKFNFRKQILHKKYGLPLTMTESEMTKELGYDRIWDCGLIKYIWKKKEQ